MSDAVASGVIASWSPGTIAPSIRNSGGTPAVRCRSDAFLATICSSKSRRVNTDRLSSGFRTGPILVGRRFLEHFLRRRRSALELLERVASQRQHAAVDGGPFDLARRRAFQHELLDARVHRHHLVDAVPAAVAGAVALDAALAVADARRRGLRMVELQLEQH